MAIRGIPITPCHHYYKTITGNRLRSSTFVTTVIFKALKTALLYGFRHPLLEQRGKHTVLIVDYTLKYCF